MSIHHHQRHASTSSQSSLVTFSPWSDQPLESSSVKKLHARDCNASLPFASVVVICWAAWKKVIKKWCLPMFCCDAEGRKGERTVECASVFYQVTSVDEDLMHCREPSKHPLSWWSQLWNVHMCLTMLSRWNQTLRHGRKMKTKLIILLLRQEGSLFLTQIEPVGQL